MEEKQILLTPELSYRLGAIDVGSNSIRLIIAEPLRDGTYRILDEEKAPARLSKGLSASGQLSPEGLGPAMEALRRMKQIAIGYQVRELSVIATCAVREATDGAAFVDRVKQELDLDVEVISAEREAHLAFTSVARSFQLEGKNVAVADTGGGSTEIILASGNVVEAICGTPLGAVRVAEQFGAGQQMSNEQLDEMLDFIDRELRRSTRHALLEPHVLIGSGGTFTTLAEMVMASKGQAGLPVRGCEIYRADVRHMLDKLRKMPVEARRSLPGLSPDRADIIVAGVAIIDRLMRHFELNRVTIHDRGVRDGLLLQMIDRQNGTSGDKTVDRDAAIDRFAATCGVDLTHVRQVAKLAGEIHAGLAGPLGLDPKDRSLLEAAARLQDVGYLINYEQHHKHSYYLILNSRLPGFQPQELELIANLARYHRGSGPKKKHDNFRQLNSRDQLRVKQMTSILRVAGGLDRTNTQAVKGLTVDVKDRRVVIYVDAESEPEVDIWTAIERAEYMIKSFDLAGLDVKWRRPRSHHGHGNCSPNGNGTTHVAERQTVDGQ
jgi:exopolyphosphatase/guanosine-5'-triphosphate,3'-diphosphate pyrophosphatase